MKNVLITGASRGIGRQTAIQFAREGYNVIINYNKSKAEAESLAKEIGGFAVKADVSDETQVKNMVDTVCQRFGFIDVLVNNSGIAQQKLFTDITTEQWHKMMNVNVNSMYYTCKYLVPEMIRQKQGVIINISSMWGVAGASCEVHYSTSKAAVIGFTKALAKELAPSNIRVNAVAPGTISTDMCNFDQETLDLIKNDTPLGKIGSPIDIANMITYLASEKAGFITGQVFNVNGGMVI